MGQSFSSSAESIKVSFDTNLNVLSSEERWKMYFYWQNEIVLQMETSFKESTAQHNQLCELFKETCYLEDYVKIQEFGAHVIGTTTTGAARYNKLLSTLKPKVVIIEEAAAILEAHTVTSLTKSCQHVIMIGDHYQLKPSTATYRFAKEYKLDVSLFERLAKKGVPVYTLCTQRRMRPEIASLVTPFIYKNLKSHPSVFEYPNVKGVKSNMFFINHNIYEDEVADSHSHRNTKEADFVLSLCNYLIRQGYDPFEITILTTYQAQESYMISKKVGDKSLKDVRITVVDNYQGEENNIVLLSLVRSNKDFRIGYLTSRNRMCVALTRAKIGFYIVGNMDCLKGASSLWEKLHTTLVRNGSYGTHLELKCQTHGNITFVSPTNVIKMKQGGCDKVCNTLLSCEHYCDEICHGNNIDHNTVKCEEKCNRYCSRGHLCKLFCFEDCYLCAECSAVNLTFNESLKIKKKSRKPLKCKKEGNFELNLNELVENVFKAEFPSNFNILNDEKLDYSVDEDDFEFDTTCLTDCLNETIEEWPDLNLDQFMANTLGASSIKNVNQSVNNVIRFPSFNDDLNNSESSLSDSCLVDTKNVVNDINIFNCNNSELNLNSKSDVEVNLKLVGTCLTTDKVNVCLINDNALTSQEYSPLTSSKNEIIPVNIKCLEWTNKYETLPSSKKLNQLYISEIDQNSVSKSADQYLHSVEDPNKTTTALMSIDKEFSIFSAKKCNLNFDGSRNNISSCYEKSGELMYIPRLSQGPSSFTNFANQPILMTSNDKSAIVEPVDSLSINSNDEITSPCLLKEYKSLNISSFEISGRVSLKHFDNTSSHNDDTYGHNYITLIDPNENIKSNGVALKECDFLNQMNNTRRSSEQLYDANFLDQTISECAHEAVKNISRESSKNKKSICHKKLRCGHQCLKNCGNGSCKTEKCNVIMQINLPCNHINNVKCYLSLNCLKGTVLAESLQEHCQAKCEEILLCGHKCQGTCSSCSQGRLHEKCTQPCRKPLLCGHLCKMLCWEDIHTCLESCNNKCVHLECTRNCKEECTVCQEKCEWKCEHFECTMACGELCNRPLCMFGCQLTLSCGHPCAGFCGEPCPPICLNCQPSAEFNLLVHRFVLLEECGHFFEWASLLKSLEVNKISLKRCPTCGTPIWRTLRLKSFILLNNWKLKFVLRSENSQQIFNINMKTKILENLTFLKEFISDEVLCNETFQLLLQYTVDNMGLILNGVDSPNQMITLKSLLFIQIYLKEISKFMISFDVLKMNCHHRQLIFFRINLLLKQLYKRRETGCLDFVQFELESLKIHRMAAFFLLYQEYSKSVKKSQNKKLSEELCSKAFSYVNSTKSYSLSDDENLFNIISNFKKLIGIFEPVIVGSQMFKTSLKCSMLPLFKKKLCHVGDWMLCLKGHPYQRDTLFDSHCNVCSTNN